MDLPPTLAGVRETRQDHPRSSYSSEPVTPSRASSDSNLVGKNNQLVSSCTTFELGFYVACVMSFWRKTTLPIHPQVHSAIPVDDQVNTVRRLAKRAWVEGVNRHRVTLSLSPLFHHCPCAASEKEKVCILQDTGYGDESDPSTTSFPLALMTLIDVVVSKRAMSKAGAETTRTRRNGTSDNALKRPAVPTLNKAR